MVDIYKSAGIIIQERKLLVSRSKDKDYFVAPGGKREKGETPQQTLVRELEEEQSIEVDETDLTLFGTFHAIAKGHEDEQLTVEMVVYTVGNYHGEIAPSNEIDENRWITSSDARDIELGSIFAHDVIPRLVRLDLID